ncbi:MAG: tyrosine-protein phosphatase [Myxococcales bacterium]|nr:tyrosine-protein phosphatase [Myxococcales bacterium]
MSLDYTSGCVNLRDVGELLELLGGVVVLPMGRLIRGGKIDFVTDADQLSCPGTIVNLRKGEDPPTKLFGADHFHFPISNSFEKYDTTQREVQRWLVAVLANLAEEVHRFPVLYHCTSGKDRTGVVIAAILAVLGVERSLIVQEYLWSDGGVDAAWINQALDGLGDVETYFRRVDLPKLREKLISRG